MPSFQPERVPISVNGKTVSIRGVLAYDVNTGARLGTATKSDAPLTYADVVALSGVGGRPTVTYTDTNGTRTLVPGDSVQPLVGGSFTVR